MKQFILRLICGPADALGFFIVLVVWLLWGTRLRWESGCLMTDLKVTSWPNRTWYANWGGTTFGHAMMLSPNADAETLRHELVHVGQFEATCVAALLPAVALVAHEHFITAYIVSAFAWIAAILAAMCAAWLGGKDLYLGSHLEAAAYAPPSTNS